MEFDSVYGHVDEHSRDHTQMIQVLFQIKHAKVFEQFRSRGGCATEICRKRGVLHISILLMWVIMQTSGEIDVQSSFSLMRGSLLWLQSRACFKILADQRSFYTRAHRPFLVGVLGAQVLCMVRRVLDRPQHHLKLSMQGSCFFPFSPSFFSLVSSSFFLILSEVITCIKYVRQRIMARIMLVKDC